MTENELPLITSSCGCTDASCGCSSAAAPVEHVHDAAGGCCGGHAEPAEHVHDAAGGCCGGHAEPADPGLAAFEAMFTEVAYAMHERFGEQGPTPEQEKDFMREWLISKGRSADEVDAILNAETQDASILDPHLDEELFRTPHAGIDLDAAESAVKQLLEAFGFDTADEVLKDTPGRVARSYFDLLSAEPFLLTTFPNSEGYDELIIARSIPFHSLCMHHLLPFVGVAHVGYLPDDRIVGLSKLARVVEKFSRTLQVQERMTAQIAGCLQESLNPKGVGVVLEAEHMCMSLRGVRKPGAKTVTSALRGAIRDDPRTRQEFLSLAREAPRP